MLSKKLELNALRRRLDGAGGTLIQLSFMGVQNLELGGKTNIAKQARSLSHRSVGP